MPFIRRERGGSRAVQGENPFLLPGDLSVEETRRCCTSLWGCGGRGLRGGGRSGFRKRSSRLRADVPGDVITSGGQSSGTCLPEEVKGVNVVRDGFRGVFLFRKRRSGLRHRLRLRQGATGLSRRGILPSGRGPVFFLQGRRPAMAARSLPPIRRLRIPADRLRGQDDDRPATPAAAHLRTPEPPHHRFPHTVARLADAALDYHRLPPYGGFVGCAGTIRGAIVFPFSMNEKVARKRYRFGEPLTRNETRRRGHRNPGLRMSTLCGRCGGRYLSSASRIVYHR
jgi:hypothetical protein